MTKTSLASMGTKKKGNIIEEIEYSMEESFLRYVECICSCVGAGMHSCADTMEASRGTRSSGTESQAIMNHLTWVLVSANSKGS